jgi:ABA responsive element binding factor
VAERAAAELAELPQDLDDKEARAMKRAIKNRESAARSRAKRQEYTATLEQQVEQLKQQNNQLRKQVITTAVAPPDPHAPKHDGELLRRSRTGPI